MLSLHVPLQSIIQACSTRALAALERLLARMRAHVSLLIAGLACSIRTLAALQRLLASVHTCVILQKTSLVCSIRALATCECLLTHQTACAYESSNCQHAVYRTVRALAKLERPLASVRACVNIHIAALFVAYEQSLHLNGFSPV